MGGFFKKKVLGIPLFDTFGLFSGDEPDPRQPLSPNFPTASAPPAPPEVAEVDLAPGELSAAEQRKLRRVGTQRLQIPLAKTKSGLGIPNQ